MKGNSIIVSGPWGSPRGVFMEGIINTGRTPKPGTCMEIVADTADVKGRFKWQECGVAAASGDRGMGGDGHRVFFAILLEDRAQGKDYNDAYAANEVCYLYVPAPGEQFNMILENQGGTGEDFDVGDVLMIDDGTGKLLESSSAQVSTFTCLEDTSALTADYVCHVMYNGGVA